MSGGVATALAEALDQDDGEMPPEIGDLFGDLDESETGALDAPSPLSGALSPRRKGGGRKPGARNRRTEAVTAWLLSQHRHPLSVMMEAYSMSPAQLAERIGLRRAMVEVGEGEAKHMVEGDHFDNGELLDILKLQVRMAEAVAPYVTQRQPLAIQASLAAGLTVAFSGVSLPARGVEPGNSGVIEGEALSVKLPFKSDDESRKAD